METLECPVCGREMELKTDLLLYPEYNGSQKMETIYECKNGHERVMVKFQTGNYRTTFVYLGDGCYLVTSDNSSCERAIARMKLEYDCEKFMGNFV